MDTDVVVVGAGLAGLLTAAALRRHGLDVLVVDGGAHPGGIARTVRADGFVLEPAAGTLLLPHPHLTPALDRAGVDTVPAAAVAARRHVYTRGRLLAVTPSPRTALAPLVTWRAKARAAVEPLVRSRPHSTDESLADLLERRFGRGLGGLVARLAAAGVFAGDPRRLSAASAFPTLAALEREAGSIVRGGVRRLRRTPRGTPRPASHLPVPDMAGLADALAGPLDDRLLLGFEVAKVGAEGDAVVVEGPRALRAHHAVLACRPEAAARLLAPRVAAELRRAVAAPVVVVWLGGSEDDVPLPDGFGALVGPDTGLRVVGILYESSYAPARAAAGHALAKVIAGGSAHPEVAAWDDERIVGTVVTETSTVLGRPLSPAFTHLVRHRPGIPQYPVGHGAWLRKVEEALPRRVHLTGWGYRGVGVAHLATDAARIAHRITEA